MSGFVLDASITLVWLLDDESHEQAETALRALEQTGAIVPDLWHSEIRNSLLVAERRNRITKTDVDERLKAVLELPISFDGAPSYDDALNLARTYQLSFYDALYLELAVRKKLPLASLDKKLLTAATDGEGLPDL